MSFPTPLSPVRRTLASERAAHSTSDRSPTSAGLVPIRLSVVSFSTSAKNSSATMSGRMLRRSVGMGPTSHKGRRSDGIKGMLAAYSGEMEEDRQRAHAAPSDEEPM